MSSITDEVDRFRRSPPGFDPTRRPVSAGPWPTDRNLGAYATSASDSRPAKARGYFEQISFIGLSAGNLLAENVLSHPCIVLRRQCQVNHRAVYNHSTPFTLFPVIVNLQQHQGFGCFWKGLSSSIILQGMQAGTEMLIGDATGLPKDVNRYSTRRKVCGHLLLKSICFGITSVFSASALIETVQSDVTSERPGLIDFIREGFTRISGDLTGGAWESRRVPLWITIVPSVGHRLTHYVFSGLTTTLVHSTVRRQILAKAGGRPLSVFDDIFPDLCATFTSHLLADAMLYPLETVLSRLFLQGTRTIVDNLDSGLEVIPINTRYEGFFDCIRVIYRDEGIGGFFKGFGALVLQYLVHLAVLRLLRLVFEQLDDRPPPLRRSAASMAGGVARKLTPPTPPTSLASHGAASSSRGAAYESSSRQAFASPQDW